MHSVPRDVTLPSLDTLQSQESSLLVQIQAMLQANQGKKVEKIDSDEDMYEDTKRAKKAKS